MPKFGVFTQSGALFGGATLCILFLLTANAAGVIRKTFLKPEIMRENVPPNNLHEITNSLATPRLGRHGLVVKDTTECLQRIECLQMIVGSLCSGQSLKAFFQFL